MKSQMKTRYIGSEERWIEFWSTLLKLSVFDIELKKYTEEIGEINKLIADVKFILEMVMEKRKDYLRYVEAYPIIVPESFKHIWLSGSVDILEIINNFIVGYRDNFEVKNETHYFKLFINPKRVIKFSEIPKYRKNFEELYDIYPFMKERQNNYETKEFDFPQPKDFYIYPNDEYINPLSLKRASVDNMFLICEGEIDVNGGALFMFADEPFSDGECEVGIYSYSEAYWNRYQTLPEKFLFSLAYIFFDAKEVYSVDSLLKVNDVFKLLYK